MQKCYQTKEFKQPEPFLNHEQKKLEPLSFDNKENKVNLRRCKKKKFYDATICRHLCSISLVLKSTKTSQISSCEQICFELTKSHELAGEICPYENYCPNGCPCKHYMCEKMTDKDQEVIPVWDLNSKTDEEPEVVDVNIYERRKDLKRKPKTSRFNVMLHSYNHKNVSEEVFVKSDVLFPHEWIPNNNHKDLYNLLEFIIR